MFNNLIIPTSTFKKIHNPIFYHQVRKTQASDIIWVSWIKGIINFADFFTETKIYFPTIQGIISNICNKIAAVVTLDGG